MPRLLSLVVCVSPFLVVHVWAQVPTSSPIQARASALSPPAQVLLDWIRRSGDHHSQPFVIIDKQHARLWIFDARASHRGDTAVLLGAARGDHSVPGIGDRPMALIKPEERTTPAGRFRAEAGVNAKGEDIFWVDYEAAVSMHRVRPHVEAERRLQRLASATPEDNRISYGCINVPESFYDQVLRPTFSRAAGWVYVLPETMPLSALFPMHERP